MTKGLKPMQFTKLSLFIAAAVGILMLGVPRAAHAVAAALVQVTNTASNPVIAQGIGNQAAQIVQIECGYTPGTSILQACFPMPATGIEPVPTPVGYTVPVGQTLVVTAVDILSGSEAGSPCMSSSLPFVFTNVSVSGSSVPVNRNYWIVPSGAGTVHYVYPSGILFSPGTVIESVANGTSACTLTLDMYGYLTAQ
jgi:hypothetical protein